MNSEVLVPEENIATLPIPFGWFCIGFSDEIAIGEVRNVHYFGRDMVLYRGESGALGLTHPYCPHLGAHLGQGGSVSGDWIRCPFHHWSYDNEGWVKNIPYTDTLPPKATRSPCLKTYPVQERNGCVWAWYHPEDAQPFTELLDIPEYSNDSWCEPKRRFWTFDGNVQDIAENGADVAHFKFIHGMDAVPEGETTYDGVHRSTVVEGELTLPDGKGGEQTFQQRIEVSQYGAGLKWDRFSGVADILLMVLVTPVDINVVEVRFAFTHKKYEAGSPELEACDEHIKLVAGATGLEADIPIWHNKVHLKQPLLCSGDGPIMRFRKYFNQFYLHDNPYA